MENVHILLKRCYNLGDQPKEYRSRREEKQAEEYQAMMRRQERENGRQKVLRDSKAILDELTQTYLAKMDALWQEKASVIKWNVQVGAQFQQMVSELRALSDLVSEFKDGLVVGSLALKDTKKKEEINKALEKNHNEFIAWLSCLFMEINVCDQHLHYYQEGWSKPDRLKESSPEKMRRAFDRYSERAEIIEDMQIELQNVITNTERNYDEITKRLSPFQDAQTSFQRLAPSLKTVPLALPKMTKHSLPTIKIETVPAVVETRTVMNRKLDDLEHRHTMLMSKTEALEMRTQMYSAPASVSLKPVYSLKFWALAGKTSPPLKWPKYNNQSGRPDGFLKFK